MQPYMHTCLVHTDGMTDHTSTFQAIKLLELIYYNGLKGEHNVSIVGGNW